VDHFLEFAGFSFLDSLNRSNQGSNFIVLKDWDQRKAPQMHADAVLGELWSQYVKIPQAPVLIFNPPAIQGLGR